jgi:hypothetical protein
MAEGNGSGRLDRIEQLLLQAGEKIDRVATMGYLHDERLSRFEAGLEQMREDEARYRAEQREREQRMEQHVAERDQRIDERIATLVSAIGKLIGAEKAG